MGEIIFLFIGNYSYKTTNYKIFFNLVALMQFNDNNDKIS